MALQQINLRIEEGLLARMKAEAKQRGLSLNSLAASAFERFLAGGATAEPSSNKLDGLAEVIRRLEVLEQKVARQSQQAHHFPHGPAHKPAAEAEPVPKAPMAQGDGLATSAELELITGTKRSTWNAWARADRIGQARSDKGSQFELVGKAPGANGGPDRWVWRRV